MTMTAPGARAAARARLARRGATLMAGAGQVLMSRHEMKRAARRKAPSMTMTMTRAVVEFSSKQTGSSETRPSWSIRPHDPTPDCAIPAKRTEGASGKKKSGAGRNRKSAQQKSGHVRPPPTVPWKRPRARGSARRAEPGREPARERPIQVARPPGRRPGRVVPAPKAPGRRSRGSKRARKSGGRRRCVRQQQQKRAARGGGGRAKVERWKSATYIHAQDDDWAIHLHAYELLMMLSTSATTMMNRRHIRPDMRVRAAVREKRALMIDHVLIQNDTLNSEEGTEPDPTS